MNEQTQLKCQVCAPQTDQCGYTMSYVGISEETQVYSDMFYFTNDDSVGVVFGATYNVTQGPAYFFFFFFFVWIICLCVDYFCL